MRRSLFFGVILLGSVLNGCAHGGRTIQSETQRLCDKNEQDGFRPGTQLLFKKPVQVKNPTNQEGIISIYSQRKTIDSVPVFSCSLKTVLGPKETVKISSKDVLDFTNDFYMQSALDGGAYVAEFKSKSGRRYLLACDGGEYGRYEKVNELFGKELELKISAEICEDYKLVPASQKQEQSAPAATPVEI